MDQEKIIRAWSEYLDKEKETPFGESRLFKYPSCATCKHWQLIDEEALSLVQDEVWYEKIVNGMEGKIHRAFKERGEVVDAYTIHLFYGFCKRFPPNAHHPLRIADYGFPLLSHENACGEWGKTNRKPEKDEA